MGRHSEFWQLLFTISQFLRYVKIYVHVSEKVSTDSSQCLYINVNHEVDVFPELQNVNALHRALK